MEAVWRVFDEWKVEFNVIQQTLDKLSKRNEQLEAENVKLRNQFSNTQRRLTQPDFVDLRSLKEALEEEERMLARIQRENVELTRKLAASGANEEEEGISLRVQESGHE